MYDYQARKVSAEVPYFILFYFILFYFIQNKTLTHSYSTQIAV